MAYTSEMNRFRRMLLAGAGALCVALGALGIFLPLLPTTPFLLLAAVCFAKSSPRLLHWLNHNRWFGSNIRNYREGRGIPMREKALTLALLWLTIGVTIAFFISLIWVKIVLLIIALPVTAHLLRVKTMKPERALHAERGSRVARPVECRNE